MLEILKPYIGEIIIGVSGLFAWLNERKKRHQELDAARTQNIQAVVDLYQDAIADLRKNYDSTIKEMKENYAEKFESLDKDIKALRENVNLWKGKYTKLKNEFEKYRESHK